MEMTTAASDVLAETQCYHSQRSTWASGMMVAFFAVVMFIFWLRIAEERERAAVSLSAEQALHDLRAKRSALEEEQQFLNFLNSQEPAEFSPNFSDLISSERRTQFTSRIEHFRKYRSRLCVDAGSIDLVPATIQSMDEMFASALNNKQRLGVAICDLYADGRFSEIQTEAMRLRDLRPSDGVNGCYREVQSTLIYRRFSETSNSFGASLDGRRCVYAGGLDSYISSLVAPKFELVAERYGRAKELAKKRLEQSALAVSTLSKEVSSAEEAFSLTAGRLQRFDATFWWTLAIHVFFALTAFLGINASYQLVRQHNFEVVEIQRRRGTLAMAGPESTRAAILGWPDNPFHPNFKLVRLKTPQEEFIRSIVKEIMQGFKEQPKE